MTVAVMLSSTRPSDVALQRVHRSVGKPPRQVRSMSAGRLAVTKEGLTK
jgi:hypothetical protein